MLKSLPTGFVAFLLSLAVTLFFFGLPGSFLFDDYPNIVDNIGVHLHELNSTSLWQAANSMAAGPLMRPLAMLSFAFNWYFSADNVAAMKVTNIALHWLSAFLLFLLLTKIVPLLFRRLDSSKHRMLALLMALIWLIHPIQISTALYIVQRMTILAALFSFASLYCYCIWRESDLNMKKSKWGHLVCSVIFYVCALFSKENAVLTIFIAYLIESSLFSWRSNLRHHVFILKLFKIGVVSVAIVSLLYIAVNWTMFEEKYAIRDFSMLERLLTQSRIIITHISQLLFPFPQNFALYYDYVVLSKSLFAPITTIFCTLTIFSGLAFAWLKRKIYPALFFGLYWFFIGHLLESTILPLEMAFEHRNYFPSVGIFIALSEIFLFATAKLSKQLTGICIAVFVLLISVTTANRALMWSDYNLLIQSSVIQTPHSYRVRYEAGIIAFNNVLNAKDRNQALQQYAVAKQHFLTATELKPRFIGGLIAQVRLDEVLMVETDIAIRNALLERLKNQPIAPEDARHLVKWVQCNYLALCKSDKNLLIRSIDIALQNNSLNTFEKALIQRDYAVYLAISNELIKAAEQILESCTHTPSMADCWVAAAKIQSAADQRQQAFQSLDRIRLINPTHPDIAIIEQLLALNNQNVNQ